MLNYKKLELCDKSVFDKFLNPYTFYTSEYSFTNLFLWRKGCNIEYANYEDFIIIKKDDFDGTSHFMQPIGYKKGDYESLKKIVSILINEKRQLKLDYLFKDAEEWFINDFNTYFRMQPEIYNKFKIVEDRDNFDYIYNSQDLINLSGRRYHSKKNHYNSFIKSYTYEIKEINEVNSDVIYECMNAAEEWYKNSDKNSTKDKYLLFEMDGICDALKGCGKLDYIGIAVYVNNKICAFSLGEMLNQKTAVIHIEKADPELKGAYAFINRIFIKQYFSDVEYINREQDLGIEGLRKSKLSYNPVRLEKKYIVNLA